MGAVGQWFLWGEVGSPARKGSKEQGFRSQYSDVAKHPTCFIPAGPLWSQQMGSADPGFTGPRLAAGERTWFRGIKVSCALSALSP